MAQTLDHNSSVQQYQAIQLSNCDVDTDNIQQLDDEPNDVGGMTAAALKATFDKTGDDLKGWINGDLIPAIIAADATEEEREAAEAERVSNEQERVSNESSRVSQESGRVSAESSRVSAESGRVSAESGRVSAEIGRVSAESGRVSAETGRVNAEAARVLAEAAREDAETGYIAQAAAQATLAQSYAKGGTSSRTGEDTDNAKYYKEQASSSATNAASSQSAASGSATAASGSATASAASAKEAQSYARGGTNSRTGEDTDNADYYREQAKIYATGKNDQGQQVSTSDAMTSKALALLYANAASGSAEDAESYAVGKRGGTDVGSTDPAYHNNSKYYAGQASNSATAASGSASAADSSAEDAEAWAVGQRNGTDVGSGDPAYHNNAKYYKEQAASIVGGDYTLRSELAGKESTSTASKAYTVGEYLTYNGAIYRVTANIAQGGTLTVGTNITAAKLGDDLAAHAKSASNPHGVTAAQVGADASGTAASAVSSHNTSASAHANLYIRAGQKSGTTLGTKATAEGYNTTASAMYSHAEGANTTASGSLSHAEGYDTTASGTSSHAEGVSTTASGVNAHAEGSYTTASGKYSHAEGYYTSAQRESQHVFGEYNVLDTTGSTTTRGQYVEIVGKGTADNARSNARTLDWNGNEVLAGKLTLGAAPTADMDAATKQYVDNAVASAGKAPYVHSFAANDWTVGTDDATLTIAAATHGLTGSDVLAQFWHQVSGAYLFNTWACVESWAEINASTHVITLHGPTTPYAGKVVLFG